jgi:hypothetical protein
VPILKHFRQRSLPAVAKRFTPKLDTIKRERTRALGIGVFSVAGEGILDEAVGVTKDTVKNTLPAHIKVAKSDEHVSAPTVVENAGSAKAINVIHDA